MRSLQTNPVRQSCLSNRQRHPQRPKDASKGQKFPPTLPFHGYLTGNEQDDSEDQKPVDLGSLDRIYKGSQSCALCHLIYYTLRRRGFQYLEGRPIPKDDSNIVFHALFDTTYHSYLTESPMDFGAHWNDCYFFLRRLSVTVKFKQDAMVDNQWISSDMVLAHYDGIAQACHACDFLPENEREIVRAKDTPRMLFAGRKRPDTIDFGLVRKWMDICASRHDLSCGIQDSLFGNSSSIRLDLIRFIDVKNQCLCMMRDVVLEKIEYAALSYVWGSAKQVKLEEQIEPQVFGRGALLDMDLPQTIRDAIEVAERLHISFLWVDVLCIRQGRTQDDIEDRQRQLSYMGSIYGNALVTIVATGDNANSGLPGLRFGSRTAEQMVVKVLDPRDQKSNMELDLVSTCFSGPPLTKDGENRSKSDNEIDRSLWNTRAWTFQERSLSRRCLLFTKEQVFWSCDGGYFCEESAFEHPNLYEQRLFETPLRLELFGYTTTLSSKTIDGPLAHLTTNRQSFWVKLKTSVKIYSERKMTNAGDIFDAFKSVLDAFERLSGETFHWGHPRSRFGSSLTWSSPTYYHHLHRRVEKTSLPTTNLNTRVILPSWSWMGWEGSINMRVDEETLESESCEIHCFEHKSSPIQITCIEGSNRYGTNFSPWLEKPSQFIDRPWYKGRKFDVSWEDIQRQNPLISETILHQIPNGHIIFFWASTAKLYVEEPTEFDSVYNSWLQQKMTTNPGLKTHVDAEEIVGTVDKMSERHWRTNEDAAGWQEFAVIGRREFADSKALDMPSKVIALQLRWRDGIAERVNIAEIEETAWTDLNPVWKLIALM